VPQRGDDAGRQRLLEAHVAERIARRDGGYGKDEQRHRDQLGASA